MLKTFSAHALLSQDQDLPHQGLKSVLTSTIFVSYLQSEVVLRQDKSIIFCNLSFMLRFR